MLSQVGLTISGGIVIIFIMFYLQKETRIPVCLLIDEFESFPLGLFQDLVAMLRYYTSSTTCTQSCHALYTCMCTVHISVV